MNSNDACTDKLIKCANKMGEFRLLSKLKIKSNALDALINIIHSMTVVESRNCQIQIEPCVLATVSLHEINNL